MQLYQLKSNPDFIVYCGKYITILIWRPIQIIQFHFMMQIHFSLARCTTNLNESSQSINFLPRLLLLQSHWSKNQQRS
jgi:hypothetical protein